MRLLITKLLIDIIYLIFNIYVFLSLSLEYFLLKLFKYGLLWWPFLINFNIVSTFGVAKKWLVLYKVLYRVL